MKNLLSADRMKPFPFQIFNVFDKIFACYELCCERALGIHAQGQKVLQLGNTVPGGRKPCLEGQTAQRAQEWLQRFRMCVQDPQDWSSGGQSEKVCISELGRRV